jgi:hypothetical protein
MSKSIIGTVLLLAILLTVPVIAYAAGRGIEWKLDPTHQDVFCGCGAGSIP